MLPEDVDLIKPEWMQCIDLARSQTEKVHLDLGLSPPSETDFMNTFWLMARDRFKVLERYHRVCKRLDVTRSHRHVLKVCEENDRSPMMESTTPSNRLRLLAHRFRKNERLSVFYVQVSVRFADCVPKTNSFAGFVDMELLRKSVLSSNVATMEKLRIQSVGGTKPPKKPTSCVVT